MAAAAPIISAIGGSAVAKGAVGGVAGALLARQMAPKPPSAPAAPAVAPPPAATAAPTPTPPEAPTATGSAGAGEGEAVQAAEQTATRGRASTIATSPGGILGTEGTRARRSLAGGGLIR